MGCCRGEKARKHTGQTCGGRSAPPRPWVSPMRGWLETQGEEAARGGFVVFVGVMRRLLAPTTPSRSNGM